MVGFTKSRSPHREARLDVDACLAGTHKQEALHRFKKYRVYPLLTNLLVETVLPDCPSIGMPTGAVGGFLE